MNVAPVVESTLLSSVTPLYLSNSVAFVAWSPTPSVSLNFVTSILFTDLLATSTVTVASFTPSKPCALHAYTAVVPSLLVSEHSALLSLKSSFASSTGSAFGAGVAVAFSS